MKIRFIINPIAGTGKQTRIEDTIAKHLDNYDIVYTQKGGDATSLSSEAVKDNIDAVIAVGGDGTVNECLIGLVNTKTEWEGMRFLSCFLKETEAFKV